MKKIYLKRQETPSFIMQFKENLGSYSLSLRTPIWMQRFRMQLREDPCPGLQIFWPSMFLTAGRFVCGKGEGRD